MTNHASYHEQQSDAPMVGFSNAILMRHDYTGSMARFWQSSYASDYIGLVLVIVLWFLVLSFLHLQLPRWSN